MSDEVVISEETRRRFKALMGRAVEAMAALNYRLNGNGLGWLVIAHAALSCAVSHAQEHKVMTEEQLVSAAREWWRAHSEPSGEPTTDPDGEEMTDAEREEVRLQIDRVRARVEPLLKALVEEGVSHKALCLGLVFMGAHHCLHDGASVTDLFSVVDIAWDKCQEQHAAECVS